MTSRHVLHAASKIRKKHVQNHGNALTLNTEFMSLVRQDYLKVSLVLLTRDIKNRVTREIKAAVAWG